MGRVKDGIVHITGMGLGSGLGFISAILILITVANATSMEDSSVLLMLLAASTGLLVGWFSYRFVVWSNRSPGG